jgi:pimeloyl-ACP methyl ester carboxylesterase
MRIVFFSLLIILIASCRKEVITFSGSTSETFFVENAGATMRVLVDGNTSSNTFILIIHGGPGASSFIYKTDYITQNLADKYAMVYWDQRNAGASQGSCNGEYFHLDQMVEDLKKVITVLKYRYGQNMSLFILGHSFGGLIAADFVTRPDCQKMIKGLIDVDGSHNYPLNDSLTRQMLLSVGSDQVSRNRNVEKWEPIISYCQSVSSAITFDESEKLESYASDAECYIDSVRNVDLVLTLLNHSITGRYPLTAILFNYLYSENSVFNKEIAQANYSGSLYKVTIPVLVLWGKYDFVCPPALGEDLYNRISSTDKKIVLSPVSGHNLMLQDEELFCYEVDAFIRRINRINQF